MAPYGAPYSGSAGDVAEKLVASRTYGQQVDQQLMGADELARRIKPTPAGRLELPPCGLDRRLQSRENSATRVMGKRPFIVADQGLLTPA